MIGLNLKGRILFAAVLVLSFNSVAQITKTYENIYQPLILNNVRTSQNGTSATRIYLGEYYINQNVVPLSGQPCGSSDNCVSQALGFSLDSYFSNVYGVLLRDYTGAFKQYGALLIDAEYVIDNVIQEVVSVAFKTTDTSATVYGQVQFKTTKNMNVGVHKVRVYATSNQTDVFAAANMFWRVLTKLQLRLGITKIASTTGDYIYYPQLDPASVFPTKYVSFNGRITIPLIANKRSRFNWTTYTNEFPALSGLEVSRFEITDIRSVYPFVWNNQYGTLEYYTYPGTVRDANIYSAKVISESPKGARTVISVALPAKRASYLAQVTAFDWSNKPSYESYVSLKVNVMEAPKLIANSFKVITDNCVDRYKFQFSVTRPQKYFDEKNTLIAPSDFYGYLVYYISPSAYPFPQPFGGLGFKVPTSQVVSSGTTDTLTLTRTFMAMAPENFRLYICGLGIDTVEGHCITTDMPAKTYCPQTR